MNHRVVAVVKKEFREYRRNKLVLMTMAMLPVIFLALPIVGVLTLPEDAQGELVTAVVGQAMLLFLLVPVVLPSTIAAHTIIGEREQRTLEPVLTTPISDRELLIGKGLAATVPSVLLGWLLFGIFVGVTALWAPQGVQDQLATFEWSVAQLLLAPGFAILAIEVGMAISARSTDVRVAQQVGGLAMLPVIGLIAVFSFDLLAPTASWFLGAAAVVAVIDVAAWRGVTAVFDRERVLTRFG